MQNLKTLLREAKEALIQLSLVKARISEEYPRQFELAQGATKRKFLAGIAIQEQKAVSSMDSFYLEKLFGYSAKKKKAADKDKSDKEDKSEDKTLVLMSKQVSFMP